MSDLATMVAISSIVSALIGYLGAVATFRSQFTTMDVKHAALVAQIERDRKSDKENLQLQIDHFSDTLARIERQAGATLRLVADMARQRGMVHRGVGEDALANFLTEESK